MPRPEAYLTDQYIFAGILLLLTIGLASVMTLMPQIVSRVLRTYKPGTVKNQPYECGITPTGSARVRFSIKFYLVAMLFILFDIEAVFLYPWSVVHRWRGWFGLVEMALFVLILLVGFVYIWKRGGFEWE